MLPVSASRSLQTQLIGAASFLLPASSSSPVQHPACSLLWPPLFQNSSSLPRCAVCVSLQPWSACPTRMHSPVEHGGVPLRSFASSPLIAAPQLKVSPVDSKPLHLNVRKRFVLSIRRPPPDLPWRCLADLPRKLSPLPVVVVHGKRAFLQDYKQWVTVGHPARYRW